MDFLKKYPLSTNELLHFPLMFPDSLKKYHIPGIRFARLETLYAFGSSCGISEGAVRTCLSRMKAENAIQTVADAGTTRYRTSALQLSAMNNVMDRKKIQHRGFLIAVYSFGTSEEKKRSQARCLFSYFGFVRFAQNSYITIGIDETELRNSLREQGLENNVYLFHVPSIGKAEMDKLIVAWNIPERVAFLESFYRDVTAFVEDNDGTDRDIFNRLGVAWVAFIIRVQGTEPPLPRVLFPEGYAYDLIYIYLQKASTRFGKQMYRYWRDKA